MLSPSAEEADARRAPPSPHRPIRPKRARGGRPSQVPILRRCSCGRAGGAGGECAECRAKRLAAGGSTAPQAVHEALRSVGEQLPDADRTEFEKRLGTGLSAVRLHRGPAAAASARAVGARAYTVGSHIVLGAGEPSGVEGRRLLAHELAHVAQQQDSGAIPARIEIGRADDPMEREAERFATHAGRVRLDGNRVVLARYAHQDCAEDDLRGHIWPADHLAKQMVTKALGILGAASIDPAVTPLFTKYFMTSSPDISAIQSVFNSVDSEFSDNDYTYECEEDCKSNDNGYTTIGFWGALTSAHIHICMNNFRSRSNECLARTIVHEFTHRYAGTDDNGYCKSGCGYSSCPSSLTAAKALQNADSYACFAYELYGMAVQPGAPAAASSGAGGSAGPVDAGLPGGVP